jgi:uncharacterized protein
VIVSASLTERCNLTCLYCYASMECGRDMSADTAEHVIEFAVTNTPPGDTLDFGFFGGEPFLCLDQMREMATQVRERARDQKVPLRLRVTTNGTLLDDEALEFLENFSVDLCVSIDGPPQVHDRNRRFADGTGSAATVMANLQRAIERLDRVQVNAVYGPDSINTLPEAVAFFVRLGVRLIHLNPDITTSWSVSSYAQFRDVYEQVGEFVVACYTAGIPVAVNLIENKVLLFLKDGYGPEDRCGMGKAKFGFASNGDMYPCERLIGHGNGTNLCIGRLPIGVDNDRLASVQAKTGNRNPECAECPVARFCMNWCGCTNYHMTGQTDLAAPVLCASEKAAITAAQSAFARLVDNDLFVDHMMAHLKEGHSPRNGDSK